MSTDESPRGSSHDGAYAQLSREHERFAFAVEAAGLVAWEWDPVTDEVVRSGHADHVLGFEPGAAPRTGKEFLARIHADDRERIREALQHALAQGGTYSAEFRLLRPDGSVLWCADKGKVVQPRPDRPGYMTGVLMDITERRRAEELQRESDMLFRLAQAAGGVATFDWDLLTGRVRCSEHYFVIFGIEPGDLTTSVDAWGAQVPPDDQARIGEHIRRALAGDEPCTADYRIVRPDGAVCWITYAGQVMRDAAARPVRMIGSILDITARKQAEEALRNSEVHLKLALDAARMGTWEWDLVTNQLAWSERLRRLLGLDHAPPVVDLGEFTARIHPEDVPPTLAHLQTAMDAGATSYARELRAVCPDGNLLWLAAQATIVRDEHGKPVRLVGVTFDITERKHAEEVLRESEARFRQWTDAVSVIMWINGRDGKVQHFNSGWYEYSGADRGKSLGATWLEYTHPEDRERVVAVREPAIAAGVAYDFELRLRRHDGVYRWHLSRVAPVRGTSGQVEGWVGTSMDVQDLKAAEQALRDSQERFEAFMENSPAGAWMKDEQGRYLYANRVVEQTLGRPRQDLLGKTDFDLLPEPLARQIQENDQAVLRSGRAGKFIEIIPRSDGERVALSFKFPFHSGTQQTFVGGMAVNITEQKRAEEALKEADRRKDEFLATLAHELRNPLAPIRNAVQILSLKGPLEPPLQWARDIIDRQAQQLTRLVDDLLDVSRITRGKIELRKERIELATVLERAIETSRPFIEASGHELTVSAPARPVFLHADLTRLAQVVANLLNNAAKYTQHGGHIWLTAEHVGSEVVIRVRDTGIGIASHMLQHIFDMFIQADTARERAQGGLGIGLTIVKSLVELHGGMVEAHSSGPGQGSELVVRLPADMPGRTDQDHGEGDAARVHVATGSRILVVDDNRDAADSLGMLLELLGYSVRIAHDGTAALALASSYRPDVMILDLGMPAMNGYEVARRVRETPGLGHVHLVALTGWGQEQERRRTQAAGFSHHLVKPVDPDALRALLASLGGVQQDRA